ncbi:MAG: response regulator receiver protein [halophilic archaeon J07HX64]|jgi:PAS/PAC sensor hybrid histidine kinase (EC 2.7.13.3)|nr:MAG: response regulator receiver protein [halophilic archaeon J07HX64]
MTERVRILHVDDDPEFAELAATFLERERESFSVDTAGDAVGGLEMLRETAYDCIVSDYDMSGMSGIELLETVRETYSGPAVRAVHRKGERGGCE